MREEDHNIECDRTSQGNKEKWIGCVRTEKRGRRNIKEDTLHFTYYSVCKRWYYFLLVVRGIQCGLYADMFASKIQYMNRDKCAREGSNL